MRFEPVVGDRFLVTWKQLQEPSTKCDVEVPGLGIVVLDEADVHYAQQNAQAAFFVRQSRALGNRFVVVSRVQKA